MNITIFGTGYVGLVSGVCLANTGNFVYCLDKDKAKINKIKKGISPIYEPGLEELLKKNKNRINPTTNTKEAIEKSSVIFIAVGTPFKGKEIDLTYIKEAAKEIGQKIKECNSYKVIVVKSTVTPETTINVVKPIILNESHKNEDNIGFCMNPEFLREGNAIKDFNNPDRIVLGVTSKKTETIMKKIYSGFKETDIIITNPTTAEMIKYTANSYLALTISFSNEIARICETLTGVDSEEVFHSVILDKRISPIIDGKRIYPELRTYMRAGCGFGGSCFPKDVKALASLKTKKNIQGNILNSLIELNNQQIQHAFNLGINKFNGKKIKRIAILGSAFKPSTDDIRESPGIKIAEIAIKYGYKVAIQDYIALNNTKEYFGNKAEYFSDPLKAIKNADLIFITTIWDEYLKITDEEYKKHMKNNAIMIDTRSHLKNRPKNNWRFRIGVGPK